MIGYKLKTKYQNLLLIKSMLTKRLTQVSRLLFICVISDLLLSCSAMIEENSDINSTGSNNRKESNLKQAIHGASYDVDNINIYSELNKYLGKIISTRGVYLEQKFFKDKERKFIVSGSNNGHPADYLVYLDHPLPKQTRIGENVQIISTA